MFFNLPEKIKNSLILTEHELVENGHKITPGLNNFLNKLAGLFDRGAGIGEILDSFNSIKGVSKSDGQNFSAL